MENGMIKWGMIGCGDVTEKKSAPSFNKIEQSTLLAVFSRNREKADSYASRHHVPKVYDTAGELLDDEEINAVYIATPPSSHAHYAIMAMRAGKNVYVEKPMAATYEDCLKINEVSAETGIPVFVAYYRRSMEYFRKVREIIESGIIGKPFLCKSSLFIPPREEDMVSEDLPWRVIPEISGGGYFHDMGCHELDILMFLFGEPESVAGYAANFGGLYTPEDTVVASIKFKSGLIYNGSWCFVSPENSAIDRIEVMGDSGSLIFSCFEFTPIGVTDRDGKREYPVDPPEHVQYPMISAIVEELQGKGSSPSKGSSGARVNWLMEKILGRI